MYHPVDWFRERYRGSAQILWTEGRTRIETRVYWPPVFNWSEFEEESRYFSGGRVREMGSFGVAIFGKDHRSFKGLSVAVAKSFFAHLVEQG
jgi:hypothetical protein